METKKKYFMDCHLAGRMYHDADEVWNELKVGTKLSLVRDAENPYDGDAVAVTYADEQNNVPICIGYIPRDENQPLASFLDMGYNDIFECRINRIIPDAHPEQQVHITIGSNVNKTIIVMAEIYTIKCPKCGNVFRVDKGVLMSWDFSKPIPLSLREETPFNCPSCNHTMSLQDDHFDDNVLEVIYAD